MTKKQRIDVYLSSNNYFPTRTAAKAAVIAGLVKVDGQVITKPGYPVTDQKITLEEVFPYVSRGALKLIKALDCFAVKLEGKRIIDIGAGSGGFSQVMLERGANEIIAIDVGYGQFDWKLRNDPKIKLLERKNIRYLDPAEIGEKADMAVIDLSFISVVKITDNLKKMLGPLADIIVLIKPQFEAGKGEVPKGGVIKDRSKHIKVLRHFIDRLEEKNIYLKGLTYSPIKGAKGNIEFLGLFSLKEKSTEMNLEDIVDKAYGDLS